MDSARTTAVNSAASTAGAKASQSNPVFDLLDVIIVCAIIGFAYSGWRRGLTWVGLSLVGLVIGVVLATLLAPRVGRFITSSPTWRPTITAALFFAIILLVQGIGTALGFRFRLATLRTAFADWDSFLGSGLAIIGVVVVTWFLALTFAQSRWTWVDHQIAGSFIVQEMASVAPTEPQFLNDVQGAITNNAFPNAFAGLNPVGLPQVQAPSTANTPGINAAALRTARVVSHVADVASCAGDESGSGFAISSDYLVTNAHVVAGGQSFEVYTPDGNVHTDVTVVLFDPSNDVAILHVPGLNMAPLKILDTAPDYRVRGAVIGYPGGQPQVSVAPMAVRGTERAEGYNIYGTGDYVTRSIVVVEGKIIPGNSGGPLVDTSGNVVGLVFAESTADPGVEGYALAIPQIAPDLVKGATLTGGVSTGPCTAGG